MADSTAPLASLSLTHVYYDPSDPVSLVCAYLALLPQALCVVYATLIWSSREAEVALMFAGQLACEAANFLLKRAIKQERPRRIHGKGYGMPSSHAQFICFWSVSLALFLLLRYRSRPVGGSGRAAAGAVSRAQPWPLALRLLVSLAAQAVAAAVAWSRIYLGYHSPHQVLVGCAAGAACAVAWFGATAVVRQVGLLAWALDVPLARWFRVRDLVVEEDLWQAGWEKWEDGRARLAAGRAEGKKDQ